jgi:hypothetical protein
MNLRRILVLLFASVGLVACAVEPAPPRAAETDRVASIVARAISYPRQDSAAGFARAANATTAARDGRLTVIDLQELEPRDPEDPLARLVFRIRLAGSQAGFSTTPEVTTCYRVEFNRYGVIGSPDRITCPADAAPASVPPAPAMPEVPVGADKVVDAALRRAATPAVADSVRADILRRLARSGARPSASLPPEVVVTADGDDLGVALTGDGDCLLARRTSGSVEVWYPPSITVQPGELSCSPETALAGLAQAAPH